MAYSVRYLIAMAACCSLFIVTLSGAASQPAHLDNKNMEFGCSSCHLGFDFTNGGGASRCISCHGTVSKNNVGMASSNILLKDIGKEFQKNFNHPVFSLKRSTHSAREILPETNPSTPRHADCADCHSPHFVTPGNPYAGLTGKKLGNFTSPITKEYELCYLCHGDSANLPVKSTNKKMEFALTNKSFHPVEGEGKNLSVISLMRPYREKKSTSNDISIIKCADCHGSDDQNGPRGPHGSKYEGLLVENFATGDGLPESDFAYGLCYKCHKRTSILNNESFPQHSRHITGARNFKGGGTSCHTCHSSHGSSDNRYLIRFNRDYVRESSSGKLQFVEKGVSTFHGECYLTCHGVDHNPKSY